MVTFAGCNRREPVFFVDSVEFKRSLRSLCLPYLDNTIRDESGPDTSRLEEHYRCGAMASAFGKYMMFDVRGAGDQRRGGDMCELEIGPFTVTRPADWAFLETLIPSRGIGAAIRTELLRAANGAEQYEITTHVAGVNVTANQYQASWHPRAFIRIDGCGRGPAVSTQVVLMPDTLITPGTQPAESVPPPAEPTN
ncbi:hypothetical protein [Aeromicrobium sp.]|uniref:hypothetical protein n=1 Tax=Aeromicrobium sp. TaxID=1871063 RepID=UPI0019AEB391|nr:hypothetical protein [Aeromicrobium sp.]MBC7633533.1 hypothetical protein [Aeromicrobium sp.]